MRERVLIETLDQLSSAVDTLYFRHVPRAPSCIYIHTAHRVGRRNEACRTVGCT